VRMVDFNDVSQLEAAMQEEGEEVAAIILEPVTGTGFLPGPPNTSRRRDVWPTSTGRSSSATRL
jgi:acetylornithine/succinyldiaminopimelate/putrescine aminotransferase